MKLNPSKFCAALLAGVLIAGPLSSQATAQAAGGKAGQQAPGLGPLGNFSDLLKGLNVGPLMMSFGGAGGQMTDFTRSNERNLLKRSDVRSELFIDSKQREQLADLEVQGKQQMQQMMMATVMKSFANNPDFANLAPQGGGAPDLSKLKEVLNASFQTMQDDLQTFQAAQDSKSEVMLKPNQIKRLHELDLQWRGLLALSEKKVADSMKATDEQRGIVDGALKEYMDTQMKVLQPMMMQAAQIGQAAAANGGTPQPGFDAQAMQKSFTDALEGDEMKKARASAEGKIKATLTPEQKGLWIKMTGQKFQFLRLDK